jgi:hypothetical protein
MIITPAATREAMPRIRAFVPPLLVAAAGAVAIAVAPLASADSTAQVSALPQENDYQPQYVFVGGDGFGFRHRG